MYSNSSLFPEYDSDNFVTLVFSNTGYPDTFINSLNDDGYIKSLHSKEITGVIIDFTYTLTSDDLLSTVVIKLQDTSVNDLYYKLYLNANHSSMLPILTNLYWAIQSDIDIAATELSIFALSAVSDNISFINIDDNFRIVSSVSREPFYNENFYNSNPLHFGYSLKALAEEIQTSII